MIENFPPAREVDTVTSLTFSHVLRAIELLETLKGLELFVLQLNLLLLMQDFSS